MNKRETDKLDRQLSSRLKRAIGDDGRADWLEVSERAGTSRPLWRWSQRRVLLVAGVLVLAVGAAGASTGLIPWLNETPKLTPAPKYPICGANDVGAKLSLEKPGKNAGTDAGFGGMITLVNKGVGDCALEGQPKVSLVGPGASNTKLQVELFPENANLPAGVKTGASVFSPDTKSDAVGDFPVNDQTLLGRAFEPVEQTSRIRIWWQNWCGPGSGSDAVTGDLALRLEIANGNIIDLPVRQLPTCLESAKPSILRFGRAMAASIPLDAALPLRPQIVTDPGGEPLTLKMDEVFHYQVALTNTSTSPFHFGAKCPVYSASAEPEGDTAGTNPWGFGTYVLNCRSVKEIEPGQTVTFSMELPIGKGSSFPYLATWYGDGTLIWSIATGLESLNGKSPTAKASITVTGPPVTYSPGDVYSVFAPGTKEDAFPRDVELRTFGSSAWAGRLVPGSRRVLIAGNWRTGLFAWNTESGRVCYVAPDNGGCDDAKDQTSPISWSANSLGVYPRAVPYIVGLARDGVEKIEVNTGSQTLRAELENNGFLVKIPKGQTPVTIIVTMADGSQKKIPTGY